VDGRSESRLTAVRVQPAAHRDLTAGSWASLEGVCVGDAREGPGRVVAGLHLAGRGVRDGDVVLDVGDGAVPRLGSRRSVQAAGRTATARGR
jgi:hypothetical protein